MLRAEPGCSPSSEGPRSRQRDVTPGKGVRIVNSPEKIEVAVRYLRKRGVRPSTAAPPLFRLLWRIGAPIPPPHFCRAPLLFGFMATWFGSVMGVLFCFTESGPNAFRDALLAGAAFGVAMTAYYRGSARRLGLPPWAEFSG